MELDANATLRALLREMARMSRADRETGGHPVVMLAYRDSVLVLLESLTEKIRAGACPDVEAEGRSTFDVCSR